MIPALASEPLQCPDSNGEARSPFRVMASSCPLLKEILKIAVPCAAASVFSLLNELINTLLIGQTGTDKELAAVGLANMMQNCCALSIGLGTAMALDTLASQAFGASEHVLCCHYLQRCRVLVTVQLVWMLPLLFKTEWLLLLIRQDAEVACHAAAYNRASAIGLFAYFQDSAIRGFLQNRQCTLVPSVISGVTSCLHVGWAFLFVVHLGLGNAGVGYANAVTWWSSCVLSSLYLAWYACQSGLSLRAVLWVQRPGFQQLRGFMRTALPSIAQLCSEWWFFEICAMLVGYLGSVALAAHVATMQLITVSFMLTIGLGTACSTIVGNAMGASAPARARHTIWVCVSAGLATWGIRAAIMIAYRASIAESLTRDSNVQLVIQRLLVIYSIAGFFDTTQNVMSAACRGLGLQGTATLVYLFAFYGVMLPAACAMAFPLSLGVDGPWWSIALGTGLATAIFTAVLCRAPYAELAAAACARMEEERATAGGVPLVALGPGAGG